MQAPNTRLRFGFLFLLSLGILSFCGAEPPASGTSPAITVFVTNSGTKYHREGCSALRRSSIAVKLADAVLSNYGPCSICDPPVLAAGAVPAATPAPELFRVNSALAAVPASPAAAAKLPGFAAVNISRLLKAEVVDHVDGDTVRVRIVNPPRELSTVETIRLIGVDTPETVHPRKEVEPFGREASDFTKSRLLGKTVYLAFDWDLRDRYRRLLAYVYTEEGLCHNAEIIREGFGHAYTRFSFQFMEEFRALEKEARENRRGLWR
jgi:micrococcal nuclease